MNSLMENATIYAIFEMEQSELRHADLTRLHHRFATACIRRAHQPVSYICTATIFGMRWISIGHSREQPASGIWFQLSDTV